MPSWSTRMRWWVNSVPLSKVTDLRSSGSIAANQAQHLVVLRRLLGAGVAESIPGAFEDGTAPPPSKEAE